MGKSQNTKAKCAPTDETSIEETFKLIKRYTNRKLYDTVESRYVTLDEIAEMIRNEEDVRIIDNRTKEDLTSVTLAQIIFEQEKKRSRMPLAVLRNIVRDGGVNLQDFFEREIQPRVVSFREEAEHRLDKMFRREKGAQGEDGVCEGDLADMEAELPEKDATQNQASAGHPPEKESAAIARMLLELRDSLEAWQRSLDQRVQSTMRDARKLPAKAIRVQSLRKSLVSLRSKLDDLESKLGELEDKS